jgi:hypothetical protein
LSFEVYQYLKYLECGEEGMSWWHSIQSTLRLTVR